MRFQKYLKRNLYAPYKYNYLDYENLRERFKKEGFASSDEDEFVRELDANIKRVFGFVESKYSEFVQRLRTLEKKPPKEARSKIKEMTEEMRHFAEFIRINVIGFKKLLRRHDKHTEYRLLPSYKPMLKGKIKSVEDLDELIYKASRISLKAIETKKKNTESNCMFIRMTDKYWVHKENVVPVKFYITQHLPIYVFSKGNEEKSPYSSWDKNSHDTCISSVYFDNVAFDLYGERLKKLHHSEAIRIRWYTSEVPDVVFVERKKHEDGWTGESSKKLRFMINEKQVLKYINGEDVWEDVRRLNGDEDVRMLYEEVQSSIVNRGLRPVVRTFYRRSAFQIPNDSSVRVSLDTDLCMIKECSDAEIVNPTYPITRWRRSDVNCDFPFRNVPKSEIVRFPHAILEIKTQNFDETKPKWIEELINGPLVEHVHKFSKYLHGCAVLYPFIQDIPYWLPQVAVDIRKDPFHPDVDKKSFENTVLVDVPADSDPSNSEKLSPIDVHGKRISIPVRVEPKVFFANERTFLSWVQFAIFLGGIGSALLGLGDERASFSGLILIIVAIIFSFYSLYLYLWRASMIRQRDPGPYDDIYGPAVLVCVFLVAMGLSVFFKFPLKRF
ncbi:putative POLYPHOSPHATE SYNTHETASE VTC4 [Encephalitozoon cuniculi GB-M1]|uniref:POLYPHOSPHATE SYNTHETASE VTC4 n=2 Tax=Encephalitozoon cuniculi TaxID=6035 RepID=Q8SRN4_ENCCU|nr:SPX domain-containing vacuolar polyphosphate accumulation protein [Encephalitozoon cuniculi GB-M1]AGE95662.1 putative polyphosphate synthetase vtc4 [Encephalitozoon cuniculi]KMV66038.1 SPX domain-containing vacuolar polyphosphateaccumulation protein [Encephalitozoon cuniculi EcunIII-L]UYI27737.1 vacuolar transporter chaperone 4 [Encephalitozoon cuniculi]CAD25502.1 putative POLYPHOSPHATE SYNTHETASE VTC4 [Encephalitozoon cuniculi GB-M1]